jgi:hypothetical protein
MAKRVVESLHKIQSEHENADFKKCGLFHLATACRYSPFLLHASGVNDAVSFLHVFPNHRS